eukprot:10342311-Prorocentrum_lima.AAC.1
MTSSLVVSEMCIRDSLRTLHVIARSSSRVEPHFYFPGRPVGRCVSVDTPVSYTHLTLPTICSV